MKQIIIMVGFLLTVMSFTACGKAKETTQIPSDSVEMENTEETVRLAFGKALWDIYQTGTLPDGQELDYTSMEDSANNSFTIMDIDNDGEEELLVFWENSSMAGMAGYIFSYKDGLVHMDLVDFPSMTFYDNGAIEVDWSHSQGLAGDSFWPYNVYQYNAANDVYQYIGGVDAWDNNFFEVSYEGEPFPTDIDVDGDGIVYYLLPADWNGENILPVDGTDYEKWRNSYLNGAQKISISWKKLTEENIAALGYKKPEVVLPEAKG